MSDVWPVGIILKKLYQYRNKNYNDINAYIKNHNYNLSSSSNMFNI